MLAVEKSDFLRLRDLDKQLQGVSVTVDRLQGVHRVLRAVPAPT